jgi:hypothetical protein
VFFLVNFATWQEKKEAPKGFFLENWAEVATFRCWGHGGCQNKVGFSQSSTFQTDI